MKIVGDIFIHIISTYFLNFIFVSSFSFYYFFLIKMLPFFIIFKNLFNKKFIEI